ncbi:MAG: helix-turn-helix domain-containing protein [Candidatus Omnitrophica bacterium]|nr:helix-turn-helix domain-containing protein [Candidatus Omnitrophota bacterium]
MTEILLTVEQVADYIQISKWTIYRWIKEKNMPVYKMGGVSRFKKSEIDEWIMNHKAK